MAERDSNKETGSRRSKRRERAARGGGAGEAQSTDADQGTRPEGGEEEAGSSRAGAHENVGARSVIHDPTEALRDRNRRTRELARDRRRARRDQEEEREVVVGLDAAEMVDDVLSRTMHSATKWVRKHSTLVQSLVVASFALLIGYPIWTYVTNRASEKRATALYQALLKDRAAVGEKPQILNPNPETLDTREVVASNAERAQNADQAYRAAIAATDGHRQQSLAQMGLAGALYDQRKYEEAAAVYEQVKGSKGAGLDEELRGRAIEGIGLSREGIGDLDGALKAFGELQNAKPSLLARTGLYHRARVLHAKGKTDDAKQALKELGEKLEGDSAVGATRTLRQAWLELLSEVDPEQAKKAAPMGMAEGTDPEELKRQLMEMLQQQKDLSPPPAGSGDP